MLLLLTTSVIAQSAPPQSPAEIAIANAQKAIDKKPTQFSGYNQLAIALARRARETSDANFYTQAEEALKKSQQLWPGNYEGEKLHVWLLLGRHEFAAALEAAKELNQKMPDDVLVYGFMVDANVELGNYDAAEKSGQWMLNLRPGNMPALTRTAYLREPYGSHTAIYGYDDAEYRGVLSVPRENLIEMARVANRLGWQMTAHTTGGGATDALLDAYEAANRDRPIADRRFTVTHGNFPNAQAIQRARRLGVAFDSQPAWLHLDGAAIKDVFGPERMRDFLPLKSMFDAGVVVAGGSDHMIRFDSRTAINPYNPFFGMWMAITRKTADGATLHPEQGVTRLEALRMWTLNGAYLSFEEKIKGSIEPGKLADMVVVSKDFLSCPVDEIKDIEAIATIVDGKVVFGNL